MIHKLKNIFSQIPLLSWLLGALLAVTLESWVGKDLAIALGMSRIPTLFGVTIMFKTPQMIPNTLAYVVTMYLLPAIIVAVVTAAVVNLVLAHLFKLPRFIAVLLHVGLLYAILHIWANVSAYHVLTLKLTMIAVILTLSLNVINGYMGEFSCSHPGFMAIGAYVASVLSIRLFTNGSPYGDALLPATFGPYLFPLILIAAGCAASISSLVVAIPSFRTRGDYLAVISLAFMFIVKSVIDNLEIVGGPRGLKGQPDFATLPVVFVWTALCLWIINNFVTSTLGKALNAVRDNELAATAMTVDTRQTKMRAYLFSAFWAGVAGGLMAHVIRYVNPGNFDLQKLAEVLAMLYFGGLNSVYGSVVGAVSINMLGEMLRPFGIYKWIIIPLLLILVILFRPTGLIAFKVLDVNKLVSPKNKQKAEGAHGVS